MFKGKFIDVGADEISIHTEYIGTAFDIYKQDVLKDIINQYWTGQKIAVYATDGEPLYSIGLINFLDNLCKEFKIPKSQIVFYSADDSLASNYSLTNTGLSIFFSANSFLTPAATLDNNAKFLGVIAGRFSPPRLRMMYEVESAFPGQCFIINQNLPNWDGHYLKSVAHLYSKERAWLENYQFEQDLCSSFVSWQDSYSSYHNICNRYKIEIVCETHTNDNYWFTEKTGRCLAAGKPFVLLAGPNSLKKLQEKGFKTFGNLIDESYDSAPAWPTRISKIVNCLRELRNSSNFDAIIQDLYVQAQFNKEYYSQHPETNNI